MLESLGGASPVASGSSAIAINWVLKDTVGESLKLIFIKKFASSFDSHPKTWKSFGMYFRAERRGGLFFGWRFTPTLYDYCSFILVFLVSSNYLVLIF